MPTIGRLIIDPKIVTAPDGERITLPVKYSSRRGKRSYESSPFYVEMPDYVHAVIAKKEAGADTQLKAEEAARKMIAEYAAAITSEHKLIGVRFNFRPGREGHGSEYDLTDLSMGHVVAYRAEANDAVEYFTKGSWKPHGETEPRETRSKISAHSDYVWIEHTDEREAKVTALRDALRELGRQINEFCGLPTNQLRFRAGNAMSAEEIRQIRDQRQTALAGLIDGTPIAALAGIAPRLLPAAPGDQMDPANQVD